MKPFCWRGKRIFPLFFGRRFLIDRRGREGKGFGFISIWLLLSGVLIAIPSPSGAPAETRVNLLLITLDTTRADSIGAYGNRRIRTPNIDALCAEGAQFLHGYSPVPLTLPAHASLMTGKYPPSHGVRVNGRHRLAEEQRTLAEMLGEQGYLTHAVIASYVLLRQYGLGQGFARYDDGLKNAAHEPPKGAEIPAPVVFEKFRDWFSGHHDRLFFSWIHFYDPHMPYDPPAEYIRRGLEGDSRSRYEGELEHVDRFIGHVVTELKARGILDRTLIVLAGDHGEAFGEHREYGHAIFAYEENLKVPLVFRLPSRISPGQKIVEPASLVDVLPTILDLLGQDSPADVQGVSLKPAMTGGTAGKRGRLLYFESMWGREERNWAALSGLFDGRYKYIELPERELYDLQLDSGERENLYRRKPGLSRTYERKLASVLKGFAHEPSVALTLRPLDLKRLHSLGYLSSAEGRSRGGADPKRGVILHNRLERLEERITRAQDLGEVKKDIREILRLSPDLVSPRVYELLFRAHYRSSEYDAAEKVCREGLQVFPHNRGLQSSLISVLQILGRTSQLIAQCHSVLETDPDFGQAHLMLSETYDRLGRGWLSLQHLEKVLLLEPGNTFLFERYAELLRHHEKNLSPPQQKHCLSFLEKVKQKKP